MPSINQTCTYITEALLPSVLAELVAIRDGLCALASELCVSPPPCLVLYTDSTQAAQELRHVNSTLGISHARCTRNCNRSRALYASSKPAGARPRTLSPTRPLIHSKWCIGSRLSSCPWRTPFSSKKTFFGAPRVPLSLRVSLTFLAA